jgi:hypothetical protein
MELLIILFAPLKPVVCNCLLPIVVMYSGGSKSENSLRRWSTIWFCLLRISLKSVIENNQIYYNFYLSMSHGLSYTVSTFVL